MQFSEIVGHAALKQRTVGNIRAGRVPHAQFFLGPRGSGVLPMALAYARYLLCTERGEQDACGSCASCRMVAKLAHPDMHIAFPIFLKEKSPNTCPAFLPQWREAVLEEPYLDAEVWREKLDGENKQLRMGVTIAADIARSLSLKAFQGGYKVMLMWLPEILAVDAANKLLKILEEPEPGTVFLLAGHDATAMLPTIISRVQLVKMSALAPEEVVEALTARVPGIDPADARAIGVRSEGDLLEAMAMAGHEEDAQFAFFRDWLRSCYRHDVADLVARSDQFAKMGRERQKGFVRFGLYMIRQCTLRWQGAEALIGVSGAEREFVEAFSKLLNLGNADGIHAELEQAVVHLERNANPKLLFVDISYRLHTLLNTKAQ